MEFLYTAGQQRLCKIIKPHKPNGAGIDDQIDWIYYWYVYDAGGNVMGVYKHTFEDDPAPGTGDYFVHIDLDEHDVYGSGRTGVRHADDESDYKQHFTATVTSGKFNTPTYGTTTGAYNKTHYTRTIGYKQYEVANHLGNVLVTVSDKRLLYSATPSTATEVDWYVADMQSYTDYYVFGAPQTGRAGGSYRYGFNGKENDNEIKNVEGSSQDYGFRMYDPRVGRFFSSDPLRYSYPHYTPYQFAGNKPIRYIDLDGAEEAQAGGSGTGKGSGRVSAYQNPAGATVYVQKGGDYRLDANYNLVAYGMMNDAGYYNLMVWDNDRGDYVFYTFDMKPEEHAQQQATRNQYLRPHFTQSSHRAPGRVVTPEQRDQLYQNRLRKEEFREEMIDYYANDVGGGSHAAGTIVYFAEQSEDWSKSDEAATYVGEPLKILATVPLPIGEGLGLVAEGTGLILKVGGPKLLGPAIRQGVKQLEWIMAKHGPAQATKYAGKSQFYISSVDELSALIENATHAPIMVQQSTGNIIRVVDAGKTIGFDATTGQATSIYTVVTNPTTGDLITAFPGLPTY